MAFTRAVCIHIVRHRSANSAEWHSMKRHHRSMMSTRVKDFIMAVTAFVGFRVNLARGSTVADPTYQAQREQGEPHPQEKDFFLYPAYVQVSPGHWVHRHTTYRGQTGCRRLGRKGIRPFDETSVISRSEV